MRVRAIAFVAAFQIVAFATTGCEDRPAMLRASLNGPTQFPVEQFRVQPSFVSPIFVASPACTTLQPFQLRFNLFTPTDRRVSLRGLQFVFVDQMGGRTSPITIPTLPTVPTPSELQFHGMPGTPVALVLGFDCGVRPRGTLVIDVDSDTAGTRTTARVAVGVG
jgi:hypothetical protein